MLSFSALVNFVFKLLILIHYLFLFDYILAPGPLLPCIFHLIISTLHSYARWSLGFVDPPLEISGRRNRCTIKALNERGTVILPAVIKAMEALTDNGVLESIDIVTCSGDDPEEECGAEGTAIRVDVTIVPPAEVGSFSEEDRSRQVRQAYGEICLSKAHRSHLMH